ncbi:hypothetical protein EDD96_4980 [Streptomyces sp. Ag109_G2-6]|uniref:hypothetical protein n=1 Tax=Streptomyces TaxID=1883 RepID=UPI000FA0D329|nr:MULTISPECIES: hypothetical protein [Streptomyces]RPF41187.1 hypothetical protein EDD96_4980 [Streptomyces sp. Ag109_G2-6]
MTPHEIDDVHRLRIMAAGVRGAQLVERTLAAPFEEVWPVMSALDFLPDLQHTRLLHCDGDRIELLARSKYGFRAHLRGFRRPGWCWLQSRFLLVGLAAAPDGSGTRIALTGGVRVPTRAAVLPFGTKPELTKAAHRLASRVGR